MGCLPVAAHLRLQLVPAVALVLLLPRQVRAVAIRGSIVFVFAATAAIGALPVLAEGIVAEGGAGRAGTQLLDVSSSFAMEELKFTTALPLDYI